VVAHLLQLFDGPAFAVEQRLGFVEADEAWRDEPALALALFQFFTHLLPRIVQPVIGDVEHLLNGLLFVSAVGEVLQHAVVGVGGLGIAALEALALGFVEAGLLDDSDGIVAIVGEMVVDGFGLRVIALAEQLVSAGQFGLGAILLGGGISDQLIAA